MASTRQLRGGDYVLRVDEEELDILTRGIQMVQESAPDFSQVPEAARGPLEATYATWKKRLDKLDAKLTNVSEPVEEEQPEIVREKFPQQRVNEHESADA